GMCRLQDDTAIARPAISAVTPLATSMPGSSIHLRQSGKPPRRKGGRWRSCHNRVRQFIITKRVEAIVGSTLTLIGIDTSMNTSNSRQVQDPSAQARRRNPLDLL